MPERAHSTRCLTVAALAMNSLDRSMPLSSSKVSSSCAVCRGANVEMLARFGRQRHLQDPVIVCGGLIPQQPFFSSNFEGVVTKEGSTCINRDTRLAVTPLFLCPNRSPPSGSSTVAQLCPAQWSSHVIGRTISFPSVCSQARLLDQPS